MIPKSHPRYESLKTRQNLVRFFEDGVVAREGLIAHGRGEAFDYLLGECTIPEAEIATEVASAYLLTAKNPVISVNGNTVVLVGKDIVNLAKLLNAKIEINLFHRTYARVKKISELLREYGCKNVISDTDARIPGLNHDRGLCSSSGIYTADAVLVPLEDGDRAEALRKINKIVIAIDLNPLSRTARSATVTIVDNVTRAIPNIERYTKKLKLLEKSVGRDVLLKIIYEFDNNANLKLVVKRIIDRLQNIDF